MYVCASVSSHKYICNHAHVYRYLPPVQFQGCGSQFHQHPYGLKIPIMKPV